MGKCALRHEKANHTRIQRDAVDGDLRKGVIVSFGTVTGERMYVDAFFLWLRARPDEGLVGTPYL